MHQFLGKWITDEEFYALPPRNVFFRQLERVKLDCSEHRDRHILFRRRFTLVKKPADAKIYISADDYYKLYINGSFVGQGPAPAYRFRYNYNVIDLTDFLREGENTLAVHTLYQGLVNRVWVSGDCMHGLILDLLADGETVLSSDESFLTHPHTGYRELSTVGYQTQFMEEYDASAPEVGFEGEDFDDSSWHHARLHTTADHILAEQSSKMLTFERILPKVLEKKGESLFADFGANYVGYLVLTVKGRKGDKIVIRQGQELLEDGRVRYELRANCVYEETFLLGEGASTLDQFDYKSFRYAELILPDGCEIDSFFLVARHHPFSLAGGLRPEFSEDADLQRIWELCVHTQKYGVQEVIQDCMEREKGFYVGDGCYTALCHMLLSGDDGMVRKLIDDGFSSSFVTDGLVTCLDCAFMQEIAEYPLMMVYLILWHYRLTGDCDYLALNYPKVKALLDCYRRDYERDGLLSHLDKWCVVEWPKNFQDGYAVDIKEGKVCEEPHISINAYYIEAVRTANKMAEILGEPAYRDGQPLVDAFLHAFYLPDRHLFRDGVVEDHVSLVGNVFPFAFGLCPDTDCERAISHMLRERGIHELSLFCSFLCLVGFAKRGENGVIREMLLDPESWLRMLREGATTTFEGWGRDSKWNTSLFHLTFSYAAVFMRDGIDLRQLFA
ncbi:MAG: family 78 glycoside hydrolase catalytic domain [Clostridia bacterium]|nr:family 78 glycoside hydrolase catalytic domain [Clostridia bacterium]